MAGEGGQPRLGAFGNQGEASFWVMAMKIVIMPGFSELIIVVNPTREVTREGMIAIIMPWFYAPWPDSKKSGIIETTVPGDTLRELLIALSERYRQANVDFELIDPKTNDLDFDYDVSVNDKIYVALDGGLDAKLKPDDVVKVKVIWRWDG
jgi:hypothetical protein